MHLASLDLNLLVALRALLDERNVTKAGQRVGLSQPAMSGALARLRGTSTTNFSSGPAKASS